MEIVKIVKRGRGRLSNKDKILCVKYAKFLTYLLGKFSEQIIESFLLSDELYEKSKLDWAKSLYGRN